MCLCKTDFRTDQEMTGYRCNLKHNTLPLQAFCHSSAVHHWVSQLTKHWPVSGSVSVPGVPMTTVLLWPLCCRHLVLLWTSLPSSGVTKLPLASNQTKLWVQHQFPSEEERLLLGVASQEIVKHLALGKINMLNTGMGGC